MEIGSTRLKRREKKNWQSEGGKKRREFLVRQNSRSPIPSPSHSNSHSRCAGPLLITKSLDPTTLRPCLDPAQTGKPRGDARTTA